MQIDDIAADRYLTLTDDGEVLAGWGRGWEHFNRVGSPKVRLEVPYHTPPVQFWGIVPTLDLAGLWPDTEHYDQNSPGIMARATDLQDRFYPNQIDQTFWLNVLRVPICVSYLAACAKVRPDTILELGTGGDSAHSTGMFHYWCAGQGNDRDGTLVSVDRHPLSHVWPRYRTSGVAWTFIQGDSVSVMQRLVEGFGDLPYEYDLIFIDSSHEYEHTLAELKQASQMTDALLMDDSTHPGVAQALTEWQADNPDWLYVDLHGAVRLLERHPKV